MEGVVLRGGQIKNPGVRGGCLRGNGVFPACGSDNNNWQPRLGVAWSPSYEHGLLHLLFGDPGKSVVRAAGAEVTQMAYLNVVLDSLNFDGTNLFTTSINTPSGKSCFLANGSADPAELASATDGPACGVLPAFTNSPSTASLPPFTHGVKT